MRLLLIALAAVCCCTVAGADGKGEHERRLAAELVVMAGDVRRLASDQGGPLERQGLEKRLAGALSSLPLLLRRAQGSSVAVAALRVALEQRDWRGLAARLDTLKRHHPFDAHRLLGVAPTADVLALGASIHKSTCAACHDAPAADSLLPAKNLAMQMKSMSREEFAARLWLGVRGDKTTALANPFSDAELAALIVWYGGTR
ncbi:MAG: hypothetical protein Q8O34_17430 [Rhodocyclaceae bacterium]|nr:hypothetical protein [Rhodocyclaceae bacterium]